MKVKKILEKLVSFDTVADKQNREIISWIERFLSEQGLQTQKLPDKKSGKINLFAKFGSKKKIGLTFVGHTDTVSAGGNWKTDPFSLVQKGDKLFGLGTTDMKGGIAAFLSAIEKADLSLLSNGVDVVFTFDEEYGFGGIKSFLQKKKITSKTVLIGEPTDGIPIVATKGVLYLGIEFFGKSVHGSNPDKGVNAISMAIKFIQVIEKFSATTLRKKKNSFFSPGYATFNLGKISGGDAVNKVPEKCSVEIEWRIISQEQKQEIKRKVKDIIQAEKMNAKVQVKMDLNSMGCRKNFIREIETVLARKSGAENYVTEGSFLQAGADIVVFGPGPMNAHIANEFVSYKSLVETVSAYEKVIQYYCE